MPLNKIEKPSLKVAFMAMLINIFEWYDYALFGLQAEKIGYEFFDSRNSNEAFLQVFAVFALGYLCRPIGGILFGLISVKAGQMRALKASVLLMSLPTLCIGLLPGYVNIGFVASLLLCVMRALQGVAIGGAMTTSIAFVMEKAPVGLKNLAVSLPMSGLCIGVFLGSAVTNATRYFGGELWFDACGWRAPFFLALPMMFLALWIKSKSMNSIMVSTKQAAGEVQGVFFLFRNYGKEIAISIFLNAPGSILFYFQAVYLAGYLSFCRCMPYKEVAFITILGYALMIALTVAAGYMADRIGRLALMRCTIWAAILCSFPIFYTLSMGNWWQLILAQVVLSAIVSAYIAVEPSLQYDIYSNRGGNVALGLSYNLATMLFGGTTPYLLQATNSLFVSAAYVIVLSIAALVAASYMSALLAAQAPKC